MVRRSSFQRVGPLDPELKLAYFMKWYGEAMRLGLKTLMLPGALLRRRLHLTNTTRTEKDRGAKEYTAVLRAKWAAEKRSG